MAKTNCRICNAEIGLMKQVQLGDREFICRDCANNTSPYFIPLERTLYDYKEHQKQLENGNKLYDAYFANNKDVEKFASKRVLIDKETGLMCISGKRGGFIIWGGTSYYMVFRIADLDVCELETRFEKDSEGKNIEKCETHFTFRNVTGLYDFKISSSESTHKNISDCLGKILGTKGFGAIKAGFNRSKADVASAMAITKNIQNIMADGLNGAATQENAQQIANELDNAFYNGREDLVRRADAAIKNVLG